MQAPGTFTFCIFQWPAQLMQIYGAGWLLLMYSDFGGIPNELDWVNTKIFEQRYTWWRRRREEKLVG